MIVVIIIFYSILFYPLPLLVILFPLFIDHGGGGGLSGSGRNRPAVIYLSENDISCNDSVSFRTSTSPFRWISRVF